MLRKWGFKNPVRLFKDKDGYLAVIDADGDIFYPRGRQTDKEITLRSLEHLYNRQLVLIEGGKEVLYLEGKPI